MSSFTSSFVNHLSTASSPKLVNGSRYKSAKASFRFCKNTLCTAQEADLVSVVIVLSDEGPELASDDLIVTIDKNLKANLLVVVKIPARSSKSRIDQLIACFGFADSAQGNLSNGAPHREGRERKCYIKMIRLRGREVKLRRRRICLLIKICIG
jgi:hypothetical protein